MRRVTLISILFLSILNGKPTENQIQGRLNIINGASAECVMHYFYKKDNWVQLEGEIGRNGIDGLYYKKKKEVIKEILVAESKWNKAKLSKSGKNKTIKQMSQEWIIKTMKKLESKYPNPIYSKLKKLIENDQYRARLFNLKPLSKNRIQISIYKIKNKGSKTIEIGEPNKLDAIDINSPKNSFETGVVNSYNECRETYLKKYLPSLTNENIKTLLKDNYLQKKDITILLK